MVERVTVEAVEQQESGRWRGRVQFPNRLQPIRVLLFEIDGDYAGVRAHCPHQGYDLSRCPLDDNGCLVCPSHNLAICLQGDGFRIERVAGLFVVPWPLEPVQ